MCDIHNKIRGSEAVIELECLLRNTKKACDARLSYLERTVEGYKKYLDVLGLDSEEILEDIVFWHFDQENHVTAIQRDCAGAAKTGMDRLDEEEELQDEFMSMLEDNVNRSFNSLESKLHWYKAEILILEDELKLHDKIQDGLVMMTNRGIAFKMRKRLDELMKSKKLGYCGWVIFVNQVHTYLGWKDIEPKYRMTLLPDRISSLELRMEEKRQEIEAKMFIEQMESFTNS